MSKEELEEGVVGGLVFNSRRDEQWARRLSALGIPERDHDLFEEDEVAALEEATKPKLKVQGNWIFLQGRRQAIASFEKSSTPRQKDSGAKLDLDFNGKITHHKDMKSLKQHIIDNLDELAEEVATNYSGGSQSTNIAGFDEPPVDNRKKKKDKFAGHKVFEVDGETFAKSVKGKPKFARYKNYMSMEDFPNVGEEIREYAKRNPSKAIILKDNRSGRMLYLKGMKS